MFNKYKFHTAVLTAALAFGTILSTPAAFDIHQAVDEVTADPLTAYTVYLGMPKSDFSTEFSVLNDWHYSVVDNVTEKAERSTVVDHDTVLEGIEIVAPTIGEITKVIVFNNYFKTPDKGIAKDLFQRSVSTIWMTLERPLKRTDDYVVWVDKDVTILITKTFDPATKQYIVNVRRFNNRMFTLEAMLHEFGY